MTSPVEVSPNAIYDDGALYLQVGIAPNATAKARREGKLRYLRVGRRVLYLGQWLLDWLDSAERVERRSADV
jgi:hypothetical protein